MEADAQGADPSCIPVSLRISLKQPSERLAQDRQTNASPVHVALSNCPYSRVPSDGLRLVKTSAWSLSLCLTFVKGLEMVQALSELRSFVVL